MNKTELIEIMAIANAEKDMSEVDTAVFDGCGLSGFGRVNVTKRQVAAMFRWQAMMLNGEWDSKELSSCVEIARAKFVIIG